jgi:hypothetical protein
MVVLLNDLRLAHGESSLGFINPYLYDIAVRYPQAFSDITTGDIACGAGHSIDTVNCCSETFYAAEVWEFCVFVLYRDTMPLVGLGCNYWTWLTQFRRVVRCGGE